MREIKKRLGRDFPVSVLINGIELGRLAGIEDSKCLTHEQSRGIARLLQEAGADAIQVRSHWLGYHVGAYLTDVFFYPESPIPMNSFPKWYDGKHKGAGANVPLAAGIKEVVSIPVIVVSRIDPVLGERVLREGKVDFIGMTRGLIADPELPNKVAAGRLEDIAPCTHDETCLGTGRCRINAFLGTGQNIIEKAEKKKKVLVVGGGPAGMEAARVAALRGHEVELYDSSNKLGGLLPVATVVKGTDLEDLPTMVRYFKNQIRKLGVKTTLGKKVDTSVVEKIKPDVVILATGGLPTVPDIPGINRHNVISSQALHRMLKFYLRFMGPRTLRWLTKFWMPIGKKVVIIGGGIIGCELAEFIVKRGRKVTIVDTADAMGTGMVDALKGHLFMWFQRKDVPMISGVKEYVEITDKGLTIITREGERLTIEADSIIPAIPFSPDTELLKSLEGKVLEIYAIGDCKEPRLIVDAVSEGLRLTRSI